MRFVQPSCRLPTANRRTAEGIAAAADAAGRGRYQSTPCSTCLLYTSNPRIAISVYVENGGVGATIALPIASLVEEYYLTDTITRPWLVDRVKNMQIYYPSYAK